MTNLEESGHENPNASAREANDCDHPLGSAGMSETVQIDMPTDDALIENISARTPVSRITFFDQPEGHTQHWQC